MKCHTEALADGSHGGLVRDIQIGDRNTIARLFARSVQLQGTTCRRWLLQALGCIPRF